MTGLIIDSRWRVHPGTLQSAYKASSELELVHLIHIPTPIAHSSARVQRSAPRTPRAGHNNQSQDSKKVNPSGRESATRVACYC